MRMEKSIDTYNYSARIIILTILFSIFYSALRYNIVGDVPWKDFPFFIMNKWLSMSAFILLTINFTIGPISNLGLPLSNRWLNARMPIGITGFLLMLLHVMYSLVLFSPSVYPKFFLENGTLTGLGGLSISCGVISFIALLIYNVSFKSFLNEHKVFTDIITSKYFLLATMIISSAHLFFMGFEGWMNPSQWIGGLPPISLISFLFFIFGFIINILGREK